MSKKDNKPNYHDTGKVKFHPPTQHEGGQDKNGQVKKAEPEKAPAKPKAAQKIQPAIV